MNVKSIFQKKICHSDLLVLVNRISTETDLSVVFQFKKNNEYNLEVFDQIGHHVYRGKCMILIKEKGAEISRVEIWDNEALNKPGYISYYIEGDDKHSYQVYLKKHHSKLKEIYFSELSLLAEVNKVNQKSFTLKDLQS